MHNSVSCMTCRRCGEPVSLTVGYRTLLAAAASPALLHFTFTQLCQATAVMDYLTLCESYAVWLLDEVPPLATVAGGPAALYQCD